MTWDAVVIGGGIGGLACAGALAARGRRVALLEQAEAVGGYLAGFERPPFRFDAAVDCVAGLDPSGPLTWLLEALGVRDEVAPIRLDPIRVSRFPGLTVRVHASLAAYREELERLFPAERPGLAAFFARAETIYRDVEALVAALQAGEDGDPRLPASLVRYAPMTYAELLALDLRDPRLCAVLSDRCPFLGAAPTRVSATRMVALMMSYFRSGAYRVAGGHQRLADALARGIRRCGGEVHAGTPARRIVVERGRCTHVLTEDGREFPVAAVVSAADFGHTFGQLLPPDVGRPVLAAGASRPTSPSFFVAYAGVRRKLQPVASSIGAFPTFDLGGLLDAYVPFAQPEPLGLTIPTVEDSSLAPDGHEVVIVHELVPQGWAERVEAEKPARIAHALERAESSLPGLASSLVCWDAATPATFARYTRNAGGAAYGWQQGAPPLRVRHGLANLHLSGHWTDMGGGVLPAALSGMRAAVRLLRGTA